MLQFQPRGTLAAISVFWLRVEARAGLRLSSCDSSERSESLGSVLPSFWESSECWILERRLERDSSQR